MSSENELKEGNIQQPEENEGSGEIEGYSYCNSHKARCLNDCGGNGKATPFLSDLIGIDKLCLRDKSQF